MISGGSVKTFLCRSKDDFLTVKVFGEGEKNILAFHGYGQDSNIYLQLSINHPELKVFSFDLFCHGESSYPKSQSPLLNEEIRTLMLDFLRQTNVTKFSLVGFSMGGKYALSIAFSFSENVENLILIAPDGIKKNFWYQLATQSTVFRWVFKSVVYHPKIFHQSAMLLDKLKLVDGRVRKFAENEMNEEGKRLRVYYSWIFHRKLFVDLDQLAIAIQQNMVKVFFVLGKHDRIITKDYIMPLATKLNHSKTIVLKSGHSSILEKFIEKYTETIRS